MSRFSVNRARTKWKWMKKRWNLWKIFQNTLLRGLELKKRGEERRKQVWEKFGTNSGRIETERLHQNRHNFLHSWNFDARLPPLEILLPGLPFGHKNDLKRHPYEGVRLSTSQGLGLIFAARLCGSVPAMNGQWRLYAIQKWPHAGQQW